MTIDLRSDTVTRPTRAMLEAMTSAELGDDVFGDDPTVNALQEKAAALFGLEAGIYCPSGTMTNQIAIKVHTQPGDEVICHEHAHIYLYEGGGLAYNSGVSARLLPGDKGQFTPAEVTANINPDNEHFPATRLVSVENTHNRGGGAIWDVEDLAAIGATCREHGLGFHLDGARLFNALVAGNTNPKDIGQHVDTISICLSKGLGAPIGSVLLGPKHLIAKARRVRKVMGGGMRQVGLLAAAGIHALDHHVDRLAEDHQRAQSLAEVLQSLPSVQSVAPVPTNIVVFTLNDDRPQQEYLTALEEKGLRAVAFGPQTVRLTTHLDFTDDQLEEAVRILKAVG